MFCTRSSDKLSKPNTAFPSVSTLPINTSTATMFSTNPHLACKRKFIILFKGDKYSTSSQNQTQLFPVFRTLPLSKSTTTMFSTNPRFSTANTKALRGSLGALSVNKLSHIPKLQPISAVYENQ